MRTEVANKGKRRKILLLAANPKDTQRLRLDEEVREIENGMRRAVLRDAFDVKTIWAVRTDDLRQALLDYEPHIVHFLGHGTGASGIALENTLGQTQLVNANGLKRLFRFFKEHVECVLLSACYSDIQASAIHQHIDIVIGMNQAIGDKAAIKFSRGFYDALGAGRPYRDAYEFGCCAVDLDGIPESLTPVIHHNEINGLHNSPEIRKTVCSSLKSNENTSSTIQKQTETTFSLVLETDKNEIDINFILTILRDLSSDQTLRIHQVEQGGIKLILEGSKNAFFQLEALHKSGILSQRLNLSIKSLAPLSENIETAPFSSKATIKVSHQEQEHLDVASSLNNLALINRDQGRYNDAEPLLQKALSIRKRLLGDEHPDVATSLNNLALIYKDQGRYNDAEPLFQEALAMRKRLLSDEHPDVASSLNNLAALYNNQTRYNEAELLLQQALAMRLRLLGDEHPDVATSLNNLALVYKVQGRYNDARALFQEVLTMRKRLLGNEHPDVASSLNNLALVTIDQGRYSDAAPLLQEALAMRKRLLGEEHPDVVSSLNNLAVLYKSNGKYLEAESLFQEVLAMRLKLLGEEHLDVATSLNNLALIYRNQGRFSKAEPLLQQSLSMRKRLLGEEHLDVASSLDNLALIYQAQGRYDEAESLVQEALSMRKRFLGEQQVSITEQQEYNRV